MSEKLHCPLCLNTLDSNGDCWPVCQYESSNAKLEFAPLTKRQVIEKLISKRRAWIKSGRVNIVRYEAEIQHFEKELESLAT